MGCVDVSRLSLLTQIEEIAKVTATEDEIRAKEEAENDGWSDDEVTDTARERRKQDMRSRLLAATGASIVHSPIATRTGSAAKLKR